MSLASEMASAASEAQSTLAQLGGAAPGTKNFAGPDGRQYLGVFRPANAFEASAVGSEMQSHGFTDAAVIILTATRAQFSAPPLGWRRQHLTRLDLDQRCLIHSITTTDSLLYGFVLIHRQGAA